MPQKRQSSWQCCLTRLVLLGPTSVKAAHKLLVKLTPGLNFINVLRAALTLADLECPQKDSQFGSVGTYKGKSCTYNVGEIDTRAQFHQCSLYSFYACRSQKVPNDTADLTVFFAHSGSACVKVAHKMLVKLTPGDDCDGG